MAHRVRTVVIVFIIMIVFPSVLFFFINPFLDQTNVENRALSVKPEISLNIITEFPGEYESYYNDNAPFRNQIVKFKNFLDYSVFRIPLSNKVIRGKDNWLFYEDTMADYKGINIYSPIQLEQIRDNLLQTQKWLADRGIEFYLFIAPNKSTVYPEFMPDYIKTEGAGNKVKQLVEYLCLNTDIPVIFPLDELQLAKNQYPVYYNTDTHWNTLGGFIGSQSLLKSLGQNTRTIDDIQIELSSSKGHDLANMINLAGLLNDTYVTISGNDELYDETTTEDGHYQVTNSNSNNNTSMFMIRDSFSDSMVNFLAPEFSKCVFMHRDFFDKGKIEQEKPDIVVFEVVERYLYTLLDFKISD